MAAPELDAPNVAWKDGPKVGWSTGAGCGVSVSLANKPNHI